MFIYQKRVLTFLFFQRFSLFVLTKVELLSVGIVYDDGD